MFPWDEEARIERGVRRFRQQDATTQERIIGEHVQKRWREAAAQSQDPIPRIIDLQEQFCQLDKATQYQIAQESARQVNRTDEAFIQELLRETRGY